MLQQMRAAGEKVTELVNGNDKTAAQRRPFYDKALTVLGA